MRLTRLDVITNIFPSFQWPTCLSATGLTETHRQELSREKLVSKLLFSIQAFTYTCCSEAAEARHLLRDSSSPNDKQSILSKFGVGETMLDGDLLLLPEPNPSVDDGFQPFDGRMGKLRYLGLALMVATSPVAKEVVQLCTSFPVQVAPTDPFDFDEDVKSTIKRAPVAYPILCGHVLSHTTAALIAVTGVSVDVSPLSYCLLTAVSTLWKSTTTASSSRGREIQR